MLCSLCGKHEADERYREVTGWAKHRASGSRTRSIHGLMKPKPTGRVACVGCLMDIMRGLDPGQPKFDDLL